MDNDLKGKRRRVSDFRNILDEHNRLDPQDKNYWSPSPPSSSDESMSFNYDSNDSETDSDAENDTKCPALNNNNNTKPKTNWPDVIVISESEADSCSSSTITDDSYSTVTGENNHNSRVFDDWQSWIPELSSSEDDTPVSNAIKRQKIGNRSITCFICGGPELYLNFICVCFGCNVGYHQLCHDPKISNSIAKSISGKWFCTRCQKSNNESSILYGNRSVNSAKIDTNSTLNNDKLKEDAIEFVNRQASGCDEGTTNIDDSSKKRKQDFYQEQSNKCLVTVKKGSSDNIDSSLQSKAPSGQSRKKKRRGLLPVIIQPFERRHNTASELRKLFETCPLSIVNFDEIFIPEEWSNIVEIPTTSVEYIPPGANPITNPGTNPPTPIPNPITIKQSIYTSKSLSDCRVPGRFSTLAGKNIVPARKHASSPNRNPATPALKRVHSPSKNEYTPTNKRVVTSNNNNNNNGSHTNPSKNEYTPTSKRVVTSNNNNNNNGSHTNKCITPIKGTDSRSQRTMVSKDKGYLTPGKSNTMGNGGDDSSSDDGYSPSKRVITTSKPVGLIDADDADFNIMSLLPPNLIPCLNFGELAFREGTMDRKKTIKRGRIFPVIK
ncbi:hypothetical protein GLOIN_2v1770628 [Rhizophagus irregularis DAOM 181602=DAOM 197198]|uniref:PHD-type domain-containing protein n=1 Tax=Rhizophagus irregularis (strain DAOM 181602 / DAOM 197198 / MUCL 43194) TaxID=747089 RepID=A0A2P4QBM4_RHIID|nr:hypothetical protein GLOIN_2v1770628 [Rhizophagus irregularis DAOM 181602=DAOM 197198]POG75027.1 hypothetical protein GLOIN_2v1770628 [Rhizophagus irregularis DAOM 181602=DAOM 197198]|eukprot:XP_025181893.1 hypothetical protein GLOIN_2v1770628 [Rhizophagus irregularis DAOM 181602=DAOM 197198]